MDVLLLALLFVAFLNWSKKRKMRQDSGPTRDVRSFLENLQQEMNAAEKAMTSKQENEKGNIKGVQGVYQKMDPTKKQGLFPIKWKGKKEPPERVTLETAPKKSKSIQSVREDSLRGLNTKKRLTSKKPRLTKSRYASRSIKVGEDPDAPQLEIIEDSKTVSIQGDLQEGIIWQQILNRPVAYGRHRPSK